jgi:MFS family permease
MRPPAGIQTLRAVPAAGTTALVFAVKSTLFGAWLARVPEVKARLGLDDGALGLALLGMPAGALVAMPAVRWWVRRTGARVGFAGVGLGFANVIPVLFREAARAAPSVPGLALAAVSSAGYVGFLAGPPVSGLTAAAVGLRGALALAAVLAATAAAAAGRLMPGPIRPAPSVAAHESEAAARG